jgi:hypothetical protein
MYVSLSSLNMSGDDVRVVWRRVHRRFSRVEALAHERQTWRSHRNSEHSASYGMRNFRVLQGPSELFDASKIVTTTLHIGTLCNGTTCSWRMVWLCLKQAEECVTGTGRRHSASHDSESTEVPAPFVSWEKRYIQNVSEDCPTVPQHVSIPHRVTAGIDGRNYTARLDFANMMWVGGSRRSVVTSVNVHGRSQIPREWPSQYT